MDEDLADRDRDALVAEVKRLRAGIRAYRDSSGHELCWHHPQLWGLLPEKSNDSRALTPIRSPSRLPGRGRLRIPDRSHDLRGARSAPSRHCANQARALPGYQGRALGWFLRGCLWYRESLDKQLPHASRTEEEFDAGADAALRQRRQER